MCPTAMCPTACPAANAAAGLKLAAHEQMQPAEPSKGQLRTMQGKRAKRSWVRVVIHAATVALVLWHTSLKV